jgi:ectoine hydroxylase-related dioxygenase (phytanoyl-CoA dioxygenase family)
MTWITHYKERGYSVFEHVLPPDLIDSHLAEFEALSERHRLARVGDDGKPRRLSRKQQEALQSEEIALYYKHEQTLRLCLSSELQKILQVVFDGEESLIGYPKTIIYGGGAKPHRDPSSFVVEPGQPFCRFWCALEDLHPDSGLLYVYPGTFMPSGFHDKLLDEHPELLEILQQLARHGWVSMRDGIDGGIKTIGPFQQHLAREYNLAIEGRTKVTFQLKKGDVVLFQPSIVHGSLNGDPKLTRKSLILDCRALSLPRYPPHVYYGSRHDHRRPENTIPEFLLQSQWGKFVCEDWNAIREWITKPIVMT